MYVLSIFETSHFNKPILQLQRFHSLYSNVIVFSLSKNLFRFIISCVVTIWLYCKVTFGLFYDGRLWTSGIWARRGDVPSVGLFLREPNPYLLNEILDAKKIAENSEWLIRRRLGSDPAPTVYQLRGKNMSAIGGAIIF